MLRLSSKGLVLFLSFLLVFSLPVSNLDADTGKIILAKIIKDVRLIRAKKKSRPKVGMDLIVKDEVVTGTESTADVRFPTEEVIRIMENSRLRINEGKPNEVTLGLTRGKIFNVVYKYVDKVTSYKVVTPTAVAGVRGTVFSAEVVDDEGTTVIMVKEGKLAVSNPAVSSEEVIVGDLQKTIVRKGKVPTLPIALTAAEIALFEIIADLISGAGAAGGAITTKAGISTGTALAIAGGAVAAGGIAAVASGGGGSGSTTKPCNTFVEQGSDAPETHTVELGKTSGTFRFDYETYRIPDRMILYYEGRALFDTGCVGTMGTRSQTISYSGNSTQLTVQVEPNCFGTTGTAWNFTVNCP